MRFALWVAGIFLASTSIALAHNTHWAWAEPRAEQIVARDATVHLPALEASSLESELQTSNALYRSLEQFAWTEGRDNDAAIFHNLGYRFRHALGKVQSGLAIDDADCAGSGRVVRGNRFGHFSCLVTSEQLEIPSAVVRWADAGNPTVVEGPPRTIGPFKARLSVHVTGRWTIAYRLVSRVRPARPGTAPTTR